MTLPYTYLADYDAEHLIVFKGYSPGIEQEHSCHILLSKKDGHYLALIDEPPSNQKFDKLNKVMDSLIDNNPLCADLVGVGDYDCDDLGNMSAGFYRVTYYEFYPTDNKIKYVSVRLIAQYSTELDGGLILVDITIGRK